MGVTRTGTVLYDIDRPPLLAREVSAKEFARVPFLSEHYDQLMASVQKTRTWASCTDLGIPVDRPDAGYSSDPPSGRSTGTRCRLHVQVDRYLMAA
jgi:hypothetical protein